MSFLVKSFTGRALSETIVHLKLKYFVFQSSRDSNPGAKFCTKNKLTRPASFTALILLS